MSIRLKLLLLLGCLTLLMLCGLGALENAQRSQLAASAADVLAQRLAQAKGVVDLKGQPLAGMANDYTFWDEMVAFVKSSDPEWAAQNLDTALDTFAVDCAWVLRPDAQLIYAGARNESGCPPLPFSLAQVSARIASEKVPRFFSNSSAGLVEMVGASIHPTQDRGRKTAPTGYLFLSRNWDAAYLAELSALLNADLQLLKTPPPITDGEELASGRVNVIIPLGDLNNQAAAWLKVSTRSRHLEELRSSYRATFRWAMAFCALTLAGLAVFLHLHVVRPLRSLTCALDQESVDTLERWQGKPHEFGELARLVTRFFIQKRSLEEEIEAREQTQKALQASELRFRQIFENAPVGLLTLDEQLRITHVNVAIQKLSGYSREELLGEHISLLIHPDELAGCLRILLEFRERKRLFSRDRVRYLGKDGGVFLVRQTQVGVPAPQGDPILIVGMLEAVATGNSDDAGAVPG